MTAWRKDEKRPGSLARTPQDRDPDRRRHLTGIRSCDVPRCRRDLGKRTPGASGDPRGFRSRSGARIPFYNARRRQLQHASVLPNAAHEALARLEAVRPGEVLIATQNIDDLHERARSRSVIHMHGELLKARCTACGRVTLWYDDLTGNEGCPSCAIEGGLRPHVVWFGEI